MNICEIKSIDIYSMEWINRRNMDRYTSSRVIINESLDSERTIYLPFEYGFAESFTRKVSELISLEYRIPKCPFWVLFERYGIKTRHHINRRVKKKEAIDYCKSQ